MRPSSNNQPIYLPTYLPTHPASAVHHQHNKQQTPRRKTKEADVVRTLHTPDARVTCDTHTNIHTDSNDSENPNYPLTYPHTPAPTNDSEAYVAPTQHNQPLPPSLPTHPPTHLPSQCRVKPPTTEEQQWVSKHQSIHTHCRASFNKKSSSVGRGRGKPKNE